jgi:hypothetical protein
MERLNESDVTNLLEKWFKTKQEITSLEAKCEKYKSYTEQIMNSKNNNSLSGTYHQLKRREMSRTTISRKDVPKDIWDKYSRVSSYPAYYLTEK